MYTACFLQFLSHINFCTKLRNCARSRNKAVPGDFPVIYQNGQLHAWPMSGPDLISCCCSTLCLLYIYVWINKYVCTNAHLCTLSVRTGSLTGL